MWSAVVAALTFAYVSDACIPSITTVSGTHAPYDVCSGALIFADEFYDLDVEKWQHENTLSGGGNWEFQYYGNNRSNSFTHSGLLFIKPTLTSDRFGEPFLKGGNWNVNGGGPADGCTNSQFWGCERQGTSRHIVNPITSARLRTANSFSFRYGKMEVRAKMPSGDWLWPAIWLLPAYNAYGTWPSSGHINLVESRGNTNFTINGVQIGTQEAGSTLHYGPYPELNSWDRAHWVKKNSNGYNSSFYSYQMEWTPDFISFSIDNEEYGRIAPPTGGFWQHGGFGENRNILSPWRYGSRMAPFDQKFYIGMNLAVGGISGYFPDNAVNPTPKTWSNESPTASIDFWKGRKYWLPTWNLNVNEGQDASLQVDYVRVWAL